MNLVISRHILLQRKVYLTFFASSTDYPAPFSCQFQMFSQLNPVPKDITQSDLLEYEQGNKNRLFSIHFDIT